MGEFVKFTLSGRSIKPKITIRKGGQIGLNNSSIEEFELKKYKFVVLFIDEKDKRIGLRPTNDEKEQGIRKMRISKFDAVVLAKKFIEMYKLEQLKTRQLDCEWDKKEDMIIAKYQ